MIVAIWNRWRQDRRWWWLALVGVVLLLDVFIGSWLIAWELRYLKEMMLP